MVKRLLLSFAAAALVSGISNGQTLNWAYALQDGNTTQIDQVVCAPDNGVYAMSHVKASGTVTFGTQEISMDFTGAVASNDPLLLMRLDKDGKVLWTVTSTEGDFTGLGDMPMAATADGGLVFATKVRTFSGQTANESVCVLKDATGATFNVPNVLRDAWGYHGIIVKVSASGAIEWIQRMVPSFVFGDKVVTDAVVPAAVAVGPEGNIYIAGVFYTPVVLAEDAELNPVNVDSTGKPTGDAFLLALTADGKVIKAIKPTAADTYATADKMSLVAADSNGVYALGMATGNGQPYVLGGKTVTLAEGLSTIYLAKLDAELNVQDVKTITSVTNSAGKVIIQPKNIVIGSNGQVAVSGAVNGGLSIDGLKIEGGNTMLHGFTLVADPTLAFTRAVVTATSISGNNGAIIDSENGKLYAYGYNMASPAVVYLDAYDLTGTSAESTRTELGTGTGSFSSFGCCFDNTTKTLVADYRTNKPVTIAGQQYFADLARFSSVLASFSFPNINGVEDVTVDEETQDGPMVYYNLQGVAFSERPTAAGFYIMRQGNKAGKVYIR